MSVHSHYYSPLPQFALFSWQGSPAPCFPHKQEYRTGGAPHAGGIRRLPQRKGTQRAAGYGAKAQGRDSCGAPGKCASAARQRQERRVSRGVSVAGSGHGPRLASGVPREASRPGGPRRVSGARGQTRPETGKRPPAAVPGTPAARHDRGPGHDPPPCGAEHSRGGASKSMHRPGFDCVKPKSLPRRADREGREKFTRACGGRMDGLPPAGTTVFVDAVHPECQGWPVHDGPPAPESPCGARPGRMGATMGGGGKTTADTTLRLPGKLERDRPRHRVVHVCLDNARHHHAKKPNRSLNGRTAASGRTSRRPTTPT